jgi:NADPH-dependent 2,4-dienoyl-CoA reductase/sulfur reductase-like enzyme
VRTVHGDVGYDALVIATGGRPLRPPVPGADLDRVHVLRTVSDAEAIARSIARGGRLLVVGAGVIGMEVASSAVALGVPVSVVEPAAVPMLRVAGAEVGAGFAARAVAAGVDLRTRTSVTGFVETADGVEAHLSDGSALHVATVVLGVGTRPVLDWLEGSGLPLADGVVCDTAGRVEGHPGVYAAGDVAVVDGHRSEHWTSAAGQGRQVAATLLADLTGDAVTPAAPDDYAWSDQFGCRLQVAGSLHTGTVRVESGDTAGTFLATAHDGDRLVGVAAVGNVRDFLVRRRELATSVLGVPA